MAYDRHCDKLVLDSFLTTYQPGSSSGNRPSKSSGNLCSVWSLGMTLAGRSEHTTKDGSYSVGDHDLGVISPQANVSHSWRVPLGGGPWKDLWFLLDRPPPWRDRAILPFPEVLPGVFSLPLKGTKVALRVRAALFDAHRVLHGRWPNRYELGMNLLEGALLWCQTAMADQAMNTDPRILRAKDYLVQHACEPLHLGNLCRHAGLSRARLSDLFKAATGTTPRMFQERERLRRARNLLRCTDKPIKEIAASVGYRYTPYFSRRFRCGTGITPQHFRSLPR
ncbi:MAG: AraC family transcriptional regulator [Kiritimatiellae bacterium]|nr:AraC family transcriptional regulator [Kiritimatiellia bacterium]